MYQTINFSMFCDAFVRADRNTHFSYAGKRAIFDYLEQYEEDTGETIELDVIAICCDFCESSPDEIMLENNFTLEDLGLGADASDLDIWDSIIEFLSRKTTVVGTGDNYSIVYLPF